MTQVQILIGIVLFLLLFLKNRKLFWTISITVIGILLIKVNMSELLNSTSSNQFVKILVGTIIVWNIALSIFQKKEGWRTIT